MEGEEPEELVYGLGVVVHAEVHVPVPKPPVPLSLPHHQEGGGLLPPPVPSRLLPRLQGEEEPLGEGGLGGEEGLHHGLHHLASRKEVSLGGEALTRHPPGPGVALRPGEGEALPRGRHQAELALLQPGVGAAEGPRTPSGLAPWRRRARPWGP